MLKLFTKIFAKTAVTFTPVTFTEVTLNATSALWPNFKGLFTKHFRSLYTLISDYSEGIILACRH